MTNGIRICDLKPSAQLLYSLMGKGDWIKQGIRVGNEFYELGGQVKELAERIESEIGPEIALDLATPWPIEERFAEALRLCMRDYPGSYVSENASRLLLRCGYEDSEVTSALGDWDGLMFRWKKEGISVENVEQLIQSAGIELQLPAKSRLEIQSWISDPPSATFSNFGTFPNELLEAIFGPRCIQANLNSEIGTPADLFSSLFRGIEIEGRLGNAIHCYEWHWQDEIVDTYRRLQAVENAEWRLRYEGGESIVKFTFENDDYVFFSGKEGGYIDEKHVLANFDAFMEILGRPERAYRIDVYKEWWHEGGHFVVGEPQKIEPAMAILEIPILRTAPSAECSIDFGLGNGPAPYSATATVHGIPKLLAK